MTSNIGNASSIRQQVFAELDKNPLLTAKSLAKMLSLTPADYTRMKAYLRKLKCEWKNYHKNERGLIRSCPDDVHNAFFVGRIDVALAKSIRESLEYAWKNSQGLEGWKHTKSKNRFLLFKCPLGRIRFFETGLVELYVRKHASLGKAMQLFCDGFTKNGLIFDIRILEDFQKGLRIRGFHAVFNTNQRLPYTKIQMFKGTNGVELILGDRTHPNGAELIVNYMEQVETAKSLIEELGKLFGLSAPNGLPKPSWQDYSR